MKYYNCEGKEVDKNEKKIIAKHLFFEETKTNKFFVRVCSNGMESGLFFNPMVHDKVSIDHLNNNTGREKFFFKSISKEAFDLYVQFLQTKNVSLLRNAQRL